MTKTLLAAALGAVLPVLATPTVSGPGACGIRAVDNASFVSCDGDKPSHPDAAEANLFAKNATPRAISAREAWRLRHDRGSRALLLDIRPLGEVLHHGMPLGSDANVPYLNSMSAHLDAGVVRRAGAPFNPHFLRHVDASRAAAGLDYGDPLVLICRTGAISRYAGELLAEYGYTDVRIVAGGFEGLEGPAAASTPSGWKKAGLPWTRDVQDGWMRLGR